MIEPHCKDQDTRNELLTSDHDIPYLAESYLPSFPYSAMQRNRKAQLPEFQPELVRLLIPSYHNPPYTPSDTQDAHSHFHVNANADIHTHLNTIMNPA